MKQWFSGAGLGDIYYELIRELTEHGRRIDSRNGPVMEMPYPVVLEYTHPGACWMCIPQRRWNPFLAMAEVLWILRGSGSVDWISFYSQKLLDFQDGDRPDFHGAYGVRLRNWSPSAYTDLRQPKIDQISVCIAKLKKDPMTRQAVMTLWDPWRDNIIPSKDYPCNNWVAYTLRDGVLDQSVVIRSNDLVWGTPINAVQFTHIQAYVAGCLGVKPGKLTYFVQNLHYYLEMYTPVMGKLIDKAYSDEKICSKSIESFAPFDDNDLQSAWSKLNSTIPIREEQRRRGYLDQFVKALDVFAAIKNPAAGTHTNADALAEEIMTFDAPLPELILDFYEPSEKKQAQDVVKALMRGRNAVKEGTRNVSSGEGESKISQP